MDSIEILQAFLAKQAIRKKRVEADILADFQMMEKIFTKMEMKYNVLCQFIRKEKFENTWKQFVTVSKFISLLMAL
jgi:uncharacterized protein YozE (UPF0346 family)